MAFDTALNRVRDLAASTLALLPGLALGLLVFGLFLLVARGALQRAADLRGLAPGVGIVLGRIGSWGVSLVGLLVGVAIAFPSISAADLFGVLGIGGVAFGCAFRDILQNLLAGILILLTRPFRIGDQIVTGLYEGTVEDIQVRATTIRTYDNRRAVIPNSTLFGEKVLVNTAYDKRRLQVRVSIGYGDAIGGAKQVSLATLRTVWDKFNVPVPPDPLALTLAGAGALAANLLCASMLTRYRHHAGSLTCAAFLLARNDAFTNIATIGTGLLTAFLWRSAWPDLIVGLGSPR